MQKWSDFQLKNVTLELHEAEIHKKRKGDNKTFAVFEIDSIPERRPFLLLRDLVYARRLGSNTEPFQVMFFELTHILYFFFKSVFNRGSNPDLKRVD